MERAKKLIDGNYMLRNLYSHIFLDRDPCSEAMERVLENTYVYCETTFVHFSVAFLAINTGFFLFGNIRWFHTPLRNC